MTKPDIEDSFEAIEFDDQQLSDVHISDEDLESEDSTTKSAKKKAKKLSKSQLSEADLKKLKRKKWLIGGAVVVLVILVPLLIPFTRWKILNALGVRSSMNFTVVEQEDKIPISNVSIWLDDTYFTTTNQSGYATFENTTLGKHSVRVQKNGYSREDLTITNGITASKSTIEIKAIGIKVNLNVRNWLTGEPVTDATATYQKDSVKSDKTGRVGIVVPPDADTEEQLQITAPGYMAQSVAPPVNVDSKDILLVSDSKDYFISKRDGKYDIFSSNADGSGQQKIIEATGKEDAELLQFSVHRGNRYAVLVANREGKVVNNRVVAGIYVLDFSTASLRKVDEGSDVQLLEWGDDTIVYQMSNPSLGYNDPNFNKISSYNVLNSKQRQIAQANYFSVALVAQNKLFYAGADGYRDDANTALTSVDLASNATKTYIDGQIPSGLTRTNYDSLTLLEYNNNYYNINIKSGAIKNIDRRVDSFISFGLSPNGGQVLWADKRDGQGTLLVRSAAQDDTRVVAKLSGLVSPTRWITDRLAIVRVVTTTETADYIIDVPTAKSAKIVDVSNVKHVGGVL